MDKDPCTTYVKWSTIGAASPDSTFTGLLAGLLIAAAAALLVQWYQGAAPPTIALFGSGVPVLTLSTYLFTVIGAVQYPPQKGPWGMPEDGIDYKALGGLGDGLCNQLWSEWLLATGSLFIGSAVLVCGLGWALVSYADNLAVELCKRNDSIKTVHRSRKFFIRLNAWLSASVTTAATALLIVTNVLYLKAIRREGTYTPLILGVHWYLLFFVYFLGLYFIGRAAYIIFSRTRSARQANSKSCAAYPPGGPPAAADNEGRKARVGLVRPLAVKLLKLARRNKLAMRVAQEFAVVVSVALGALLSVYLTSEAVEGKPWGTVNPVTIIYVVVLYIVVRAIYVLVADMVERASAKKDDTPTNNETSPAENAESPERIRIKYDYGRLTTTTYNIVFLAILGTFFVVALTQGPLLTPLRISMSLFLGGLYPAVVLAGLSSSVPAAEHVRLPKWETAHLLGFIP